MLSEFLIERHQLRGFGVEDRILALADRTGILTIKAFTVVVAWSLFLPETRPAASTGFLFLNSSRTKTSVIHKPLKRHGGKHYLSPKIVELMPPHLHYVEPYCGGAAVLFRRPLKNWFEGHPDYTSEARHRGCSELINDIDGNLMAFFRVVSHREMFSEMQQRLELMPFSQPMFEEALASLSTDAVDLAVNTFILARQSRQGLGKDFATMSRKRTRGGINEQCNAWLSAIAGLPEVHARLRSVVVLNEDALKVIRSQDGPYTLFYLDPPYLHETRTATNAYEFEMSAAQHRELLDTLSAVEGRFLLSGYHSAMYDDWAADLGLNVEEIEIDNKSSGSKAKETMVECVWSN